ncbi:hypothetical protein CDD81_6550 [Ophiocordyceps australis]|uniref:Kri1-like C-terminal domain-containing protein n=1 Tax=Ophiocordyceps australis TaxID=1399860 RepID=A0A2C5Y2L0_9HYPO|nr:hypothetical protein CDD81_6550 [Ophiocordyceps australis]
MAAKSISETALKLGSEKRTLLDSDSDSDSDNGGAPVSLKVNQEFARRFEHNKKREEIHRLEDKYKNKRQPNKPQDDASDDKNDSSSSSETEDEDGFLATEDLDAQISATLHAIRTKDPRVYDTNVTFVQLPDDEQPAASTNKKEKPVFLRDYHRGNLLRGDAGAFDDEKQAPQTYNQEQHDLKRTILSEIKAAESDNDSEDDGIVKRKEPAKPDANGLHPTRAAAVKSAAVKLSEKDIANADENPDTFLSNFMAARAWIPEEGGKWKAFESDDGDEDDVADEWEQAYNMRFEDPAKSNEVLKSYARDFAAARSVRREEKTGRRRQRELQRDKKEQDKRQKHEEKARLRKLKVEEAEEKLRKVRQAAGALGQEMTQEALVQFLDEAWEDGKWEQEMQKRFGDDYYAMEDDASREEEESEHGSEADEASETRKKKKKKKHPKKPKWDNDIDIDDIVPDFADDDGKPPISLGDTESTDDEQAGHAAKKRKTLDHKRARLESQRASRRQRAQLEALVDAKLHLSNHDLVSHTKQSSSSAAAAPAAPFRYRETSPQTFGMTPRDILLAPSDQALNEFAGLKKLAPFRDAERKRRDRKRLGKKARLREWRRGVFGQEFEREGPTFGFERLVHGLDDCGAPGEREASKHGKKTRRHGADDEAATQGQDNIVGEVGTSRKKRKRSKGTRSAHAEAS